MKAVVEGSDKEYKVGGYSIYIYM